MASYPSEQATQQDVIPNFGSRLPPALLDEIATSDPHRILWSTPKSHILEEGFEDYTYLRIANAVNRCAHWLQETLGNESRIFCYVGPLDLRYQILTLAAPKVDHLAFFTSHRNSHEAHLSLLERTGCSACLLPRDPLPIIRQVLQDRPLPTFTVPELEFFLDTRLVDSVPFSRNFEDARNQPFVILHTSGSTGIPKPVPVTYGSYGSMDAQLAIPSLGLPPTFLSYARGKRVFLALPGFHAASLNWTIGIALFAGVVCILPPPAPLTAELASHMFEYSKANGAIMAPSLAVDCYNDDIYCVKMLQNLEFIVYGGGMLPTEVGNALSKRTRLLTLMGSCETSLLPHEVHEDPADWEYISLSPALNVDWREERDGLHNLVMVKDSRYEIHQGVFSTFPNKVEHSMGDLFERHPDRTKHNLWRFRARVDDIISFTTAEKLNPITMESCIQTHPLVRSAVIGGQGQFQASLLLEPREYPRTVSERAAFLEAVWPTIALANKSCPTHGRIMKGFVMLTDPAKPLPRASKDTVQRHQVFKLYAREWAALYESLQQPVSSDHQSFPRNSASAEGPPPSLAKEIPSNVTGDGLSQGAIVAIEDIVSHHIALALEQIAALLRRPSHQRAEGHSNPCHTEEHTSNSRAGMKDRDPATTWLHIGSDLPSPESMLRKVIFDALTENIEVKDVTHDSDLFKCGLDSVQVLPLVNAINVYLIKSEQPAPLIKKELIYKNPTISGIARAVLSPTRSS